MQQKLPFVMSSLTAMSGGFSISNVMIISRLACMPSSQTACGHAILTRPHASAIQWREIRLCIVMNMQDLTLKTYSLSLC